MTLFLKPILLGLMIAGVSTAAIARPYHHYARHYHHHYISHRPR